MKESFAQKLRRLFLVGGVRAGTMALPHGATLGDGVSPKLFTVFAPPFVRMDLWLAYAWKRWRRPALVSSASIHTIADGRPLAVRMRLEVAEGVPTPVVVTVYDGPPKRWNPGSNPRPWGMN